jgi:hypothetical protein
VSGGKLPLGGPPQPQGASPTRPLDPQTIDLMEMVASLSRRDLAALTAIVRRTAEISETEGEDVAIAVIDQIQGILVGRKLDA